MVILDRIPVIPSVLDWRARRRGVVGWLRGPTPSLVGFEVHQGVHDDPVAEREAEEAIGWALRQYARVDGDWVRAFVAERGDRLSGLSRREALKHL